MRDNAGPRAACWKTRGVFGDASCPDLAKIAHCHNCETYSQAGRALFDREIPSALSREWTVQTGQAKSEKPGEQSALVVFLAGNEWLAVEAAYFLEVSGFKIIRPIPGRSDERFLGLANLSGELILCFDLAKTLELGGPELGPGNEGCLILLGSQSGTFALRVSHTLGIQRLASQVLCAPPDTLAKSGTRLCKAVFSLEEKQVGLLDVERLFELLNRSIQG